MATSATDYLEVRWRVKSSGEAWSAPRRAPAVGEIVVEELDRSKTYEFEVRAVSNCGAKSLWVSGDHAVPAATSPGSVDTLTAQSLADGVHLGWTSIATPSAGIEYSVERSPNGTSSWAERTRLRSTAYTDPETSGTTYYYRVRAVNFAGDFGTYSPIVDSHGVSVAGIGADATAALADAAAAQADADAANYELANIASDNILSQGEKPPVINDYNVIVAEQAGIDAQATAYATTTEKTAYDAAVTALTSYLATLTTPTLWSNLAGDTTIVGTTFRTKFADVYTTRQTLLNAIYAGAKAKADAAQGTANTANANGPAVINPQFANSLNGWTAGGTGWSVQTGGANLPDPVVNTAAVHTAGGGAASTDALVNAAHIPVVVGQQVTVTCCVNEVGVNAGALGYARISWRDASNTEIGASAPTGSAAYPNCGAAGTGTYTKCVTKVIAPAPAGAQYAIAEPTITGHTAGTFLFSNVCMTAQPSSVGEVPDGGGRYGVHQVDSNNLAIIDFTQAGHVSKNVDNIGDGSTYARIRNNQLFNGVVPSISFGTNLIPNPTFSNNNSGAPNTVSANGAVSDGWTLAEGLAGMTTVYRESTSSGTDINVRLNSGFVVPASLSYTPTTVSCSAAIDVTAGRNYKLSMTGSWQVNASIPAGISMLMRVRIAWYTGGGTYLGEYTIGTGTQNTIPAGASNITAPAYAQKAFISLQQYISNSNASSVTISGLIADMRFNSVYFGMMTNLDDEVQDGSTYARPLGSEMTSGVHKLGIAGSGKVLGNQYNVPNSLTMTYGATQSTTSLSATSAGAVSIAAFTIYTGSVSASYSAVTNAVTGLSVGSSYYIYCHDAGGSGGTKTWYAAATIALAMQQGDDVVFAGKITIPSSGSSGGGGSGCPVREAWVIRKTPDGQEYCRAGDVEVGDQLLLTDGRCGFVSYSQAKLQPCVRVVGKCGYALSCSESAPLGTCDGETVLAAGAAGHVVRIYCSVPALADGIASVESIGQQWVQHITCEDDFFWTGDDQACLFSHHNIKPP